MFSIVDFVFYFYFQSWDILTLTSLGRHFCINLQGYTRSIDTSTDQFSILNSKLARYTHDLIPKSEWQQPQNESRYVIVCPWG